MPPSPPIAAGEGVRRLVEVMDTLLSPGGCPWDAEQTHESLVPHLVEEAFEYIEAVETGDRALMREELGDVLLQVIFHARLAQADAADPFDLDEVAAACAAKLVERHPHVFADGAAETADEVRDEWERIKQRTKSRDSVLEGIPVGQPALQRAQKVLSRVQRAGLEVRDDAGVGVGKQLLELVARAQAEGLDAETELRGAIRDYEAAVLDAEAAARDAEAAARDAS